MNRKLFISTYLPLILILIIAIFLRLYNITQLPPGLYPDEAMNGNNAIEALSTGHFKVFYPENNGREGLFMNIQAISLKFFGNEPWALRVVSATFGILTVLGVYFLARELFSEKIALLSALLLATSFWHINFSRIGFRAIMAPFFLTWAVYFLLKSLNSILRTSDVHNINNRFGTLKVPKLNLLNLKSYVFYSILGGIFFGLGFHSYIAFRVMPAVIIVVWLLYWFKNKDKAARKKILISAVYFTIVPLIVFVPLGIYFLKNPHDFLGRTSELSVTHSKTPLKDLGMNIIKTTGMFNFVGDWNWRQNYAGRPELFWPVGILFLTGIIIGLYYIFKKRTVIEVVGDTSGKKSAFIIIFAWLIIAALPVVISNEAIPHALRSILMIPPVFILAGFGGVWLYELATKYEFFTNIRIKKITAGFILIFLSLLVFEAYYTYFIRWGKNPNVPGAFAADYAQIGYELRAMPTSTPKYVIVQAQGVDVRGIPMPAQTVMFLTDTFTPEKQKGKNLFYVLPNEKNKIPENAYTVVLK